MVYDVVTEWRNTHALLDSRLGTVVGFSRKIRRVSGRKAKNGEVSGEACRKASERVRSGFQENPLGYYKRPYRNLTQVGWYQCTKANG